MILTKDDLRDYLRQDLGRYCNIIKYLCVVFELWVRGSESLPIWTFMYSMRHYEYYYNQKHLSVFGLLKKHYWRFVYRHNELRSNLFIGVNRVGPGFRIVHPGFRRLHTVATIGSNCTILPMVLIGKKNPKEDGKVIIGDNCYISTGVTILAPVKIGDNVTIGAGAVVTKDVPDNAVVGGIPATIIKIKK